MESKRCVSTLHPMVGLQYSYSGGVSMAADRSRVVHFMAPSYLELDEGGLHDFMAPSYRKLDEGGLHVWDLLPDGTQAKYELVHGCKNRFGFEIASAAVLCQDSKRRVEQCSSLAVRFERVLKSDKKRKLSSAGRSSREGQSGCITIGDKNEFSEATNSMLLMRVEVDVVAESAKSYSMQCRRVANCQDRVLVAAVDGRNLIVLDALTTEVIYKFFTEESYLCGLWRRLRHPTGVIWLSRGMIVE
jgi:hypothetical protein